MIDKPTKRFLSDEDKLLNGLDIKGREAIKKAIEIRCLSYKFITDIST